MSSNCFYLHNEARLSILLISERRKSKSALDKQHSSPPSLPPLLICAFSPLMQFFQLFGLLRSTVTLPGTPPQGAWVLGGVLLSPLAAEV